MGLLNSLFGTGYVGASGARDRAPGLVSARSAKKRRLEDMDCLVSAKAANLQYLIVSTSSFAMGIRSIATVLARTRHRRSFIRSKNPEVAPTSVTTRRPADGPERAPWAEYRVGEDAQRRRSGARVLLPPTLTGTTAHHGDQPKVMKLLGDLSGGEMFVSAVAQAPVDFGIGTYRRNPSRSGAASNASEARELCGSCPLPSIRPTQPQPAT